jgi:hypothetical protein
MLSEASRWVNGLPSQCDDFLRKVPGDFRQATTAAYNNKCLAVTIMLDRPEPDDPVAAYVGSGSISVELGRWGTKSGRSCLPGPSYSSLLDELIDDLPPELAPFADDVRSIMAPR